MPSTQFLRITATLIVAIGLGASVRAQERPNAVLIVADCMGYGDIQDALARWEASLTR